jgi:hypothetical protein
VTGFFVETQTNADFSGDRLAHTATQRCSRDVTPDIPARTAAQRIGDALAILLRNYVKRKRTRNRARQSAR